MILGVLVVAFAVSLMLVDSWLRLGASSTFNQRMAIVAPLITDQQSKELRAKWALMKSRRDYDAIQEQLAAIARDHQVVMPENKLYPGF